MQNNNTITVSNLTINDHEKRALKLINGLNPYNCEQLIGHGFGPEHATEIGYIIRDNKIESTDDLEALGFYDEDIDSLYHWAVGLVATQHSEMLMALRQRYIAKTTNRSRYLPVPVLQYRQFDKKTQDEHGNITIQNAQSWRFDMMLRSAGLISLVVETIHGPQSEPVAMQLVNMLPHQRHPQSGKELSAREIIPPEEWDAANANQIAVSGERLGWNMESKAWAILNKAFPNSVNLSAYGHSLNSAVLPEGYWANIPVQFQKLVDSEGNDLGTDGSGLWNTDHPAFEGFIAKHGICCWQIRGINPRHGIFAKGAVRPVSLGADQPAFILDWNQVKGFKKEAALEHREKDTVYLQKGMYVGCMQVWNKPRATLKSCFEMLENIAVNERTVEIIKDKVDQAFAKLERGGPDRIIGQIAQDDPRAAQIVQLVNVMRNNDVDVHAAQIPTLRKAVKAKLERILWHIVQGAGIAYQQRICILDNTVTPGHIVATGVRPGTRVTAFRFPMVLAQGLRTLVAEEPKPHMLCGDNQVQCCVFMHPTDLTTCMQGDDDGDIVGISTDPDMAELFEHLVDDHIYHIEPEGIKIHHDSSSPSGLEFLRWDQRGPVGAATNHRSSLLAVGDVHGANAMSIIIQEAVDAAKRKPEWTDYRAAAILDNWTTDENGEYHCNVRFGQQDLVDGDLDLEAMQEWVNNRLIERGCAKRSWSRKERRQVVVADNACAWRWQGKRVPLDEWKTTDTRTSYTGGNLVHICHDYAFDCFQTVKHAFHLESSPLNLTTLLSTMLEQRGIVTTLIGGGDSKTYNRGLRKKCGLAAFGRAWEQIMQRKYDAEEKYRRIDKVTADLYHDIEQANLTIDEIVTIWTMENLREVESGVNNAFRVLSSPGNPVMAALDIHKEASCKHVLATTVVGGKSVTLTDTAVNTCMLTNDPQATMAAFIYEDEEHHKHCHDENGSGIHLHECSYCSNNLTDALVRKIRSNKQSSESKWLASIVSKINHR